MSNLSSLMLPSCKDQLDYVMFLNERYDWGLELSDFPVHMPNQKKLRPNEQFLLSVCLPRRGEEWSIQRTFDKLWEAISVPDGFEKERMKGLRSNTMFLKNAQGTERKPGAYWIIVNLSDNYERKFGDCKGPGLMEKLAGAEMFMFAIQCPQFFQEINDSVVCGLAGYTFRDCKVNEWTLTPCLCVLGNRIYLCLQDTIDSFEHWVIPEFSLY